MSGHGMESKDEESSGSDEPPFIEDDDNNDDDEDLYPSHQKNHYHPPATIHPHHIGIELSQVLRPTSSPRMQELIPTPPSIQSMDSTSSLREIGDDIAADQPLIKPLAFWASMRSNPGSVDASGPSLQPGLSLTSQPSHTPRLSDMAGFRPGGARAASVSDPPPTSFPRMMDAIFNPRPAMSGVDLPLARPVLAHKATSVHSMPSNLRSIVKRAFSADSGLPFVPEAQEERYGKGGCSWLWSHGRIMILLILLGTIMSGVGHAINTVIEYLSYLREEFVGLTPFYGLQMVCYVSFMIVVALVGVLSAELLDPTDDCQGSGLPLLKYILAGEVLEEPERHLKAQTLLAKITGLALAAGSGLSIGQEGPHVHMAAIISWLLMKHFRCFGEIFRFPSLRRQILDAACAVGVSTTFMAPIGGVLFSIEATTNYFEISNYWKCFLAATAGFLVTRALMIARGHENISVFDVEPSTNPYSAFQIPTFALIGLILGLMGSLYVKLKVITANVFSPLNETNSDGEGRGKKYILAFVVALLSGLAFFLPGPLTRMTLGSSITTLFAKEDVAISTAAVYVVVRFLASIVDTNLRIPSGDFMPLFSIGAGVGRLIGEMMKGAFPDWAVDPAGFSMCGAAAMSAAATQTISSAVITMELTGNLREQLPIFISVLVAYVVSRGFSPSIYDAMMRGRYLRYLPSVRNDKMYMLTAEDLMERDLVYIPLVSTYDELIHTLRTKPFRAFPVVTSDREFLGVIKRRSLLSHLRRVFREKLLMDHLYLLLPRDFSAPINYYEGQNKTPKKWHTIHKTFPRVLSSTSLCQLGPLHPGTEEDQKRDLACLLNTEVDLRYTTDLPVDPSPFRVSELCGLSEVYALFDLIRCSSVFVVSYGVLVGVISRRILIANLKKVQLA